MSECDLLLTGGTVIDGTGAPGVRADVAIGDGQIVGVGDGTEWHPTETMAIDGLVVSPGFIDVHTHDDVQLVDHPAIPAKLSQGVTTVVGGNCGVSAAPIRHGSPLPPPFPVLGEPEVYRFETVAAYRDALAAARPAINLALLAGHTSLRVGNVADLDRAATSDEVTAMTTALAQAIDEGCIGLSSGVDYPPAAAATADELVGLLSALEGRNGAVYTTHIRNEGDHVLEALDEAIDTATRADIPLVISHHKCAGPANYGRSTETLARIDAARANHDIALDVYPYVASSTSLLADFAAHSEETIIGWSTPHPELAGRSLDDVAAGWECSRDDAIDRLTPAGAIYFQMHDDDVDRIMSHPAAMIGSDGLPGRTRPHPRLWGTFPRVLGHYVRERKVLELARAVHKMTGLPASRFPVGRRGVIEVGAVADLCVFDPATVIDTATFDDPEQPATGIDAVIVAGDLTWSNGVATGTRNGQMLTLT